MDAEMAQFSADLLQSVREMQANQRAATTHVTVSQLVDLRLIRSRSSISAVSDGQRIIASDNVQPSRDSDQSLSTNV